MPPHFVVTSGGTSLTLKSLRRELREVLTPNGHTWPTSAVLQLVNCTFFDRSQSLN